MQSQIQELLVKIGIQKEEYDSLENVVQFLCKFNMNKGFNNIQRQIQDHVKYILKELFCENN